MYQLYMPIGFHSFTLELHCTVFFNDSSLRKGDVTCLLQKAVSSSSEDEYEQNDDLALAMGFSGFGGSK
jgi:hypothetical protein